MLSALAYTGKWNSHRNLPRADQPEGKGRAAIAKTKSSIDFAQTGSDWESMDALLKEGAHEVRVLRRGDVVDGQIVRITGEEVMIDVGLKAEGVVVGREFFDPHTMGDRPEINVGDLIPVYVLQPEGEGAAMLSIRRAVQEKAWRETEAVFNEGRIIEARVTEFNKGGVLVDVGPRGFVPMSQLVSLSPSQGDRDDVSERLGELVGRTLKMKIIEMDRRRNRLILSERAAERDLRSGRREALLDELEVGQIRRGRVSNLASFGAFIDLGGADGLAHISELSWSRVSSPSEVLQPGQEIDVYILSLDRDEKKIALSVRRAHRDPWESIDERFVPEQVIQGTVTKIAPFGVFVRIDEGVEGLAHASDLGEQVMVAMHEGESRTFKILSVETARRRIRLMPTDVGVQTLEDFDGAEGGEGKVVATSDDADSELAGSTETVGMAMEPEAEAKAKGRKPRAKAKAKAGSEAETQAGEGNEATDEVADAAEN